MQETQSPSPIDPLQAYVFMNIQYGEENAVMTELRFIDGETEVYFAYGVYDIISKIEQNNIKKLEESIFKARSTKHVLSTMTVLIGVGKRRDYVEPTHSDYDYHAVVHRHEAHRLELITKTYLRRKYPDSKLVYGNSDIRFYLVNTLHLMKIKLDHTKLADFILRHSDGHFTIIETTIGGDIDYKLQQLRATFELLQPFHVDSVELHVPRPFLRRKGRYKISENKLYNHDVKLLPVVIGSNIVRIKTHPLK